MTIPEQFLSEDQLRRIAAEHPSEMARTGALHLLSQIEEMRASGGRPACVLQEDGTAFVMDTTEMMGT